MFYGWCGLLVAGLVGCTVSLWFGFTLDFVWLLVVVGV